jgi:tRNA pseudouridine55 synthase
MDRAPTGVSGPSGDTPEGIVVVDKPGGWTSHDVVARMRRLAGTRRVGHAGTLDPMATGVLVLGIGRATRLLGHIAGSSKAYTATIRLGWSTVSDDAQGERLGGAPAAHLTLAEVVPCVEALTGPILQRPSKVSAVKVGGRRAHARVRAGEEVELRARRVLVSVFDVLALHAVPAEGAVDLDVDVECSSGTYVRALARDLGVALGVGGHLTALRRTRVGGFHLEDARTLDQLAADLQVLDLATAAHIAFPVHTVAAHEALAVCHGRRIDLSAVWAPYRSLVGGDAPPGTGDSGTDWSDLVGPLALFDPAGALLALAVPNPDATTRYLAVFGQP